MKTMPISTPKNISQSPDTPGTIRMGVVIPANTLDDAKSRSSFFIFMAPRLGFGRVVGVHGGDDGIVGGGHVQPLHDAQ